jgi:hypothetical protein
MSSSFEIFALLTPGRGRQRTRTHSPFPALQCGCAALLDFLALGRRHDD